MPSGVTQGLAVSSSELGDVTGADSVSGVNQVLDPACAAQTPRRLAVKRMEFLMDVDFMPMVDDMFEY